MQGTLSLEEVQADQVLSGLVKKEQHAPAQPAIASRTKLNKFKMHSLADIGFQNFQRDSENDPAMRKQMQRLLIAEQRNSNNAGRPPLR